jgi:hypothetical protein
MNYKKVVVVLIMLAMLCGNVSAVVISDLGNGVYFFDGYPNKFGSDLSQFLTDHPQQRVASIAAYDGGMYGYTSGYYVVLENKTPNYMMCYPISSSHHNESAAYNYTCSLV